MSAGRPSPLCPRAALKHALSALELAHDIRLQLGFELEFTLLRPAAASEVESDGEGPGLVLRQGGRCWVPVDDSIYCQSSAFDQMAPGESVRYTCPFSQFQSSGQLSA